ncbi:hypothetical protein ABZ791_32915 [Streptomyces huasconensis]|uniref:Uncharacterized protein n=1 Tax=Streptomyces huasconensis TaxID=1854574 RepID=A0ABV3LZX2_9ACTN
MAHLRRRAAPIRRAGIDGCNAVAALLTGDGSAVESVMESADRPGKPVRAAVG